MQEDCSIRLLVHGPVIKTVKQGGSGKVVIKLTVFTTVYCLNFPLTIPFFS